MNSRHPGTQHLLNLFEVARTDRDDLNPIYRSCYQLAHEMADRLPDGPELTAGLRKLLEAKDCFIRHAVINRNDS